LKAVEERRNNEQLDFKTMSEKLEEERGKCANFNRRVDELAQQLVAQGTQNKILGRRAEESEKCLLEQSQLVKKREIELIHLHCEFEAARKAEADLRVALVEIDGREHIAIQNLAAENAKLQSALDRANGERMRLAYELANKNSTATRSVGHSWKTTGGIMSIAPRNEPSTSEACDRCSLVPRV
jgi:hypothetical protein